MGGESPQAKRRTKGDSGKAAATSRVKGKKGISSKRLPAPQGVRTDRAIAVLAIVTLVAVTQSSLLSEWTRPIFHRDTIDWADPEIVDSRLGQTLEGLAMSWRGNETMNEALATIYRDQLLQGKISLVTGGNRGLGRSIAATLMALGSDVIITSRKPAEQHLIEAMDRDAGFIAKRIQSGQGAATSNAQVKLGRLHVVQLDLADMNSVRQAVDQVKDVLGDGQINRLILNAGVAPGSSDTRTKQGLELAVGVNCVGHYLFTTLLFEKDLVSIDDGRIIVVTSETFRSSPPLDIDTLFDSVEYGPLNSLDYYARSKLAVNTVTNELRRRLQRSAPATSPDRFVRVHTMCPGPVVTNIAGNAPMAVRWLVDVIMAALFQHPDTAAVPVVVMAGGNEFGHRNGVHLHMFKEKPQRADAEDTAKGRKLVQTIDDIVARHVSE